MLISRFNNLNIDEIKKLEESYNIILPVQYKLFLSKYNGGYTPKTKFHVKKISSDIRGFYGLGDVGLSLDKIDLKKWICKGIFPIACDSFGNNIVICIKNINFGKIYFSDHELGEKLNCIGENLVDFIKKCKSSKINPASIRSIEERERILIENGNGDVITETLRMTWQTEIDKYSNMLQEKVIIE